MTALLEPLGWLIFLVGIGFSIGLHEIGHLMPAKAFGVKVTQYMVGFGPTIWARRSGETEYGIKAVPLGGYIRMIGMYPPEKGADPTMLRASTTSRFGALINDARRQSLEEVGPDDADRVFYKLPVHKRVVVMLGGPFMNLFLAIALLTVVVCLIGLPQATTTIGMTSPCTPTTASPSGDVNANGTCAPSTTSPAAIAGIQRGDRIVSFNGTQISSWDQMKAAIAAAPQGEATLVVDRNGTEKTLTVPIHAIERPVYDEETGKPTGATETRNFIGVVAGSELVRQSVTQVPVLLAQMGQRAIYVVYTFPARIWDLARQTFTSEPRDPNGIVGVVGAGRLTGDMVALQDTPVMDKAASILGLLAGLNLFLFLFNLIPLLPLDGGHVAGALWEALKRAWARVRHLPDPGPVDIAKALPLTYVVSFAFLLVAGLTVIADVFKPVTF